VGNGSPWITLVIVVASPLTVTVERVTGAADSENVVETKVFVVEGVVEVVDVVLRVVVEEEVVEDVVEVEVVAAPQ
jgi:hypothetical protein